MKRRFNLIALVILVSVNVLTPVSYAQLEIQGKMVGERIEVADLEYSSGNNEELGKILENNNRDLVDDLLEDSLGKNVDQGLLTQEYDQNSNDVVVGVSDDFEESKGQDGAEVGSSLEVVLKSSKEITIQEVQEDTNSFSDEVILEGDEVDLGNLNLASIDDYGSMNIAVAPQAEQIDNAEITVQLEGNDMEDFTFREISVEFADGEYYTLMDRNLGAKEEFNGDLDNPNELSFGYFYQYGNNHGFSWKFSGSSGFAVGSNESLSTDVLLEDEIMGYGPGGENGYYSSNIFIYGSGNWYEGTQQLWGDWKNTDQKQIKGPCPDGWHVPTSREIMNIRGADAIVSLLKMPFAGFRYYKDGVFYNGWRTFKTSSNETVDAWSFLKFMTVNGGYVAVYQTIDNGQKLEEKNIKIFSNFSITDKNGNIKFQLKGKDSANGAPVRCFKNYNYITFDSNGGIGTGKQKVDYGRTGNKPENPTRDGYYFIGWYEDPTYSGEVFDFTTPIENDITLYARRGEIIYNDGDITYTDTNGKVFSGMGTITFTDGEKSITMLDRNLGATATGTGEDAYGYYFQWGNNYGFLPEENDIDTERVDVTGYGWNNPYANGVFVANNKSWIDTDEETEYADNLRGGFDDYRNNTWDSSIGHDYMRQGPCPEGYHVPSGGEWLELVSLWSDDHQTADDALAIDTKKHETYLDFASGLLLPKAGKIDYSGYPVGEEFLEPASVNSLTLSNRNKNIYLWTSSPYYRFSGSASALYGSRRLFIAKSARAQSSVERAYGFPIRCFKDNYEDGDEPLVLSYDTRGGSAIQAQTIPEGENEYLPGYTTHRTGYELLGWYDDKGKLELSGNKIANRIMEKDSSEDGIVTIYAKWNDDYVVTFKDYNGSVIKVVLVRSGSAVQAPADPSRDGYKFTGWDKDLNNVSEDMEVIAQYSSSSKGGYSGGGGSSSNKSIKSHNLADEADKTVSNDEKSKGDNDELKKEVVQPIQGKTLDADTSSKETFNAHQWAYSKGLTKYRTSTEARMDDPLNRSEMAKISSIFAEQFLDKLPNDKKQEFCSQYPDLWKVEDDMKFFIIESCKLGYMGYESNGVDALAKFRPYTPVTVAEAATILSRIVWGNDNAMNGKDWYKGHLYATYNHGLIDDIKDPTKRSITRREAYLMLYRLIND